MSPTLSFAASASAINWANASSFIILFLGSRGEVQAEGVKFTMFGLVLTNLMNRLFPASVITNPSFVILIALT